MNIFLSHLSFPISGTDLKDKKVVPKWYMGPKGDNKRVYHIWELVLKFRQFFCPNP